MFQKCLAVFQQCHSKNCKSGWHPEHIGNGPRPSVTCLKLPVPTIPKMLSAILILAALPWLDTSKIRSAVFRPMYKQFYWILVADVLILGYVGAMPAEGLYLLIARVATAYYFLHFLVVLPVLGMKEKTLPVPLSITEPVLGGSPNLAMAKNKESLKE